MSTLTAPHICAVLSLPTLELSDSNCASLSVEQIATIEKALSDKDAAVASLEKRITALERKPAESTSAIVNDKPSDAQKPETAVDAFAASVRSAREIYDLLP